MFFGLVSLYVGIILLLWLFHAKALTNDVRLSVDVERMINPVSHLIKLIIQAFAESGISTPFSL